MREGVAEEGVRVMRIYLMEVVVLGVVLGVRMMLRLQGLLTRARVVAACWVLMTD